jgi:hypothetical protein
VLSQGVAPAASPRIDTYRSVFENKKREVTKILNGLAGSAEEGGDHPNEKKERFHLPFRS